MKRKVYAKKSRSSYFILKRKEIYISTTTSEQMSLLNVAIHSLIFKKRGEKTPQISPQVKEKQYFLFSSVSMSFVLGESLATTKEEVQA